jgi:hypothetical protein
MPSPNGFACFAKSSRLGTHKSPLNRRCLVKAAGRLEMVPGVFSFVATVSALGRPAKPLAGMEFTRVYLWLARNSPAGSLAK